MKLGASVASSIHGHKSVTKASVILPSQFADASIVQNFSTAFYDGLYSDNRYRTGKKVEVKAEKVETVSLSIAGGGDYASSVEAGLNLARGISMTKGDSLHPNTFFFQWGTHSHLTVMRCSFDLTKDIVNAPHNILNSISLARTAQRLASESKDGCITCEILGKAECEERGMGAYLGVSRGSETEPQLIHLVYKPKGEVKKKVGVIGKGLLFVSFAAPI